MKNTLQVRAWGWEGMEGYLDYAADTTAKCLAAMEDYTGIKYNLDKIGRYPSQGTLSNTAFLDLVAVPYLAGAMENWGLIISHYDYVYYEPNVGLPNQF